MISAVILTKNSEKYLDKLVSSLSFCDEIVFVDDNSTDGSLEKLGLKKIKTYKHKLISFAESRNFGMKKARGDWVFFIDSDELPDKKLKQEIVRVVEENKCDGFFVRRKDIFLGREMRHGGIGKKKLVRLARKDRAKWRRAVHEVLEVKGKVGELEGKLVHHHNRDLTSFIAGTDWYSTLHAKENASEGKKSSITKIIFFPPLKFLYIYILKLGFLDGVHGFMMAAILSSHGLIILTVIMIFLPGVFCQTEHQLEIVFR